MAVSPPRCLTCQTGTVRSLDIQISWKFVSGSHYLVRLVKVKWKLCYDRRSVGQSVAMSSTHLGPKLRFLLLSKSCRFVDVGPPLSREDESVVYNSCGSSPAQSFSSPIPVGLMTISYSLRFETPPTWRARSPYFYSPKRGWPSYTSKLWVPFLSSLTTRRVTVEVFEPASTPASMFRNSLYSFGSQRIESPVSQSSSVVACLLCAAITMTT
jgi:hypothetical protein